MWHSMRSACFACQASVSPSSQTTSSSPKSASGSMKLLQSARAKELAGFLKTVPAVQHAFAYGSGIFKQEGLYSSNKERPMLDFILAVDDPESWHNEVHHCDCPLLKDQVKELRSKNLFCQTCWLGTLEWNIGYLRYPLTPQGGLMGVCCNHEMPRQIQVLTLDRLCSFRSVLFRCHWSVYQPVCFSHRHLSVNQLLLQWLTDCKHYY